MKVILALCLLGVASAALNYVSSPYSYGAFPYTFPYTAGNFPYTAGVIPYTAGVIPNTANVLPYTGGVIPYAGVAHSGYGFPSVYSVPVQYKPVEAKVVQPGYVAKTPGSTHIAPLPAGLGYASHHINVAPAPGTQ
nr:uncharacterized protein LOC123759613 [Procambarus clarkii]